MIFSRFGVGRTGGKKVVGCDRTDCSAGSGALFFFVSDKLLATSLTQSFGFVGNIPSE